MKKLLLYLGVLTTLLMFSSCSQEENSTLSNQSEYIVSFEEAKIIAADHFSENNKSGIALRDDNFGESTTFKGENDLPGLHIFNHQVGEVQSFVIISGDNRVPPILAHGDNEFPLDYIPFGVADWMDHEIKNIDGIRSTNSKQEKYIEDFWEGKKVLPIDDDCCRDCPNWPDCELDNIGCGDSTVNCNDDGGGGGDPCGSTTYYEYGPLMDTEWGQGCVYNEMAPTKDCKCDHSVTGCVATAMSQVINYFEHPSSYDYASILPRYTSADFSASGADEVAQLMFDAGDSVDMDWGCTSGAKTKKVDDALEDDFGYTDGGDYGDYGSSEPVKQNIRWNKPVIFAGCREKVTFIFTWGYKGCHAWVCDGYKGHRNQCYSYLYYHMNWGWNNLHNGWFSYSSWSPGTRNYQYNKRVLLNIKP